MAALALCPVEAPPLSAQEKPPDHASLPVQMRAQETELWCWAATGQMIMEFFGKEVSQSLQANLQFRRTDCAQRPVPPPCVRGGEITIRPFGFAHGISTRPLTEEGIVRQIHGLRKPVPFAWRWPGGGGHASLLVGYARQEDGTLFVECLDPYPPPGKDARSWGGGQRIFMPYQRWVRDYDHVFAVAYYDVNYKP
jgi:hypothetical protein